MNVRVTREEELSYKQWAARMFLEGLINSATVSDLVRLAMDDLQAHYGLEPVEDASASQP